jgi:hypothetical protein
MLIRGSVFCFLVPTVGRKKSLGCCFVAVQRNGKLCIPSDGSVRCMSEGSVNCCFGDIMKVAGADGRHRKPLAQWWSARAGYERGTGMMSEI